MWYYIKQALIPFVYLFFMALLAFSIITIQGLVWLKVILLILNFGLYAGLICTVSFKEGEEALKVQLANDLERREIIRTGEDRPLRLKEEYKAWKGFLQGFISCVPLIVMLIIHTILILTVGEEANGVGAVSSFIYMMFTAFIKVDETVPFAQWNYYFPLIAVPILSCLTGFSYILGAKKIERQQQKIKQTHRLLHGDDNN